MKKAFKFEYKPNCYVLLSPLKRDLDYGDTISDYVVSLLYDNGDNAAEWEPRHGPIMSWYRADGPGDRVREHYFYDYVEERQLAWSQVAVDNYNLRGWFLDSDLDYCFSVLREWSKIHCFDGPVYLEVEEEDES